VKTGDAREETVTRAGSIQEMKKMPWELIVKLLDRPELPEFMGRVIVFLAACLVTMELAKRSARISATFAKSIWSLYNKYLHDRVVLGLHALFDWPELRRSTWRPVDAWNGVAGIGLGAVSVLCFGCYLAVGAAAIFLDPGPLRPVWNYGIAVLVMLLCISCSRAFMIAGVKHWNGIR
jgi:hypothetical protein